MAARRPRRRRRRRHLRPSAPTSTDPDTGEERPRPVRLEGGRAHRRGPERLGVPGDIGITIDIRPEQPCTDQQPECVAAPERRRARGRRPASSTASPSTPARWPCPPGATSARPTPTGASPSSPRSGARRATPPSCAPGPATSPRPSTTRSSGPTPTCSSTTWATAWPTGAPRATPTAASGARRRCGASAWSRPSTATPGSCTTAGPAASRRPCCGTVARPPGPRSGSVPSRPTTARPPRLPGVAVTLPRRPARRAWLAAGLAVGLVACSDASDEPGTDGSADGGRPRSSSPARRRDDHPVVPPAGRRPRRAGDRPRRPLRRAVARGPGDGPGVVAHRGPVVAGHPGRRPSDRPSTAGSWPTWPSGPGPTPSRSCWPRTSPSTPRRCGPRARPSTASR